MHAANYGHATNYIAGRWTDGPAAIRSVNPSDVSDVIGEFAGVDAAQVRQAIDAASDGFNAWSTTPIQRRFDVLDAVGAELLARADELGALIAREEGKPVRDGIAEAKRAGYIFKFAAGEALRNAGEHIDSTRPGLEVHVSREPLGVVAVVTPWNFPIAIPAWKIAPALASGCAVLFKPASYVPACAVELVRTLERNGLPPGVVNLIAGPGSVVGDELSTDSRVAGVSFTGSVSVGRRLAERLSRRGARVQLEMGGKNPLVVLDDAPLARAIEIAVDGSFFQAGQRCTASSRLIVTEAIFDRFVEGLRTRVRQLRVDHALKSDIDLGPVVDASALENILSEVRHALDEGGDIAEGGSRLRRSTEGHYMAPTLVLGTSPGMRINREEVFGPVASVLKVRDYEEALAEANSTSFGLSAGICTQSLKYASDFRRRSQSGLVMVNVPTAGLDYHVPFGGRKESSLGPREQGHYGRDFYTIVKTSYVNAI